MKEYCQVLRAEDYFETYGRNGIGKGMDRTLIRRQMIDAFRKEIFGLVAMRAKKSFDTIPPEGDPEAIRIARNVIKDETKKWIKVCNLFEKYVETRGLLSYEDISIDPEDAASGRGQEGGVTGTEVTDEEIPEEPSSASNDIPVEGEAT